MNAPAAGPPVAPALELPGPLWKVAMAPVALLFGVFAVAGAATGRAGLPGSLVAAVIGVGLLRWSYRAIDRVIVRPALGELVLERWPAGSVCRIATADPVAVRQRRRAIVIATAAGAEVDLVRRTLRPVDADLCRAVARMAGVPFVEEGVVPVARVVAR